MRVTRLPPVSGDRLKDYDMRLSIIHRRMLIRSEAMRYTLQGIAVGAGVTIALTGLFTLIAARLLGH